MKRIIVAAAFAALMTAGSVANAAIVVFNQNALPTAANKVTTADITVGDIVVANEILFPADTAQFTFTALKDLKVSTISLSGVGVGANNVGAVKFGFTDLNFLTFGINGTVVPFPGGVASAFASLPGGTLKKNDFFTIFWAGGLNNPVGVGASFFTTAIPVPAALPLLIGGIAALGLVARKRRT